MQLTARGWGIEVEVENNPIAYNKRDATVVEEGSLRNNGREYVSNVLDTLDNAINWHTSLVRGLNEMEAEFTERCGTHIHMDFSGNGFNFIIDFLKKYTLVENYLFERIDPLTLGKTPRSESNFCLPLLSNSGHLIHAIRAGTVHSMSENWLKYSAINLRRLNDLGSIEFRGLPALPSVRLFNKTIRVLNDVRCLDYEALKSKYNISDEQDRVVKAFWEHALSENDRNSSIDPEIMKEVFGYEEPEVANNLLTAQIVIDTMRELGQI